MSAIPQLLSPVEARILGVLIEKEKTTPDVYPLSVNRLTAGCNQKTFRDPVMSLSEGEVQAALEELHSRLLVLETSGRVMRYAHNFGRGYQPRRRRGLACRADAAGAPDAGLEWPLLFGEYVLPPQPRHRLHRSGCPDAVARSFETDYKKPEAK